MYRVIWLAALLIPSGASLQMETPHECSSPEEGAEIATDDLSALRDELAFGLYGELAARAPAEGVLFSPLGLASALAELARVSRSHARAEILAALGLHNGTEERVERALAAVLALEGSLTERRGDAQLDISDLLPKGENRSKAAGDPSRPQQALAPLPPLSGRASTDKLVLTNKVHFKGKWEQPFDSRQTVHWRFQVNGTWSVGVSMMFRDDSAELRMLYDTNCSTTVAKLPYSGRLASLLLLPRGDLAPLEGCLSGSKMKFWLSNLKAGRAEIRFPKFAMRKSYTLVNILKTAGVRSVFTKAANLTNPSKVKDLTLSQALHEVQLLVDETKSKERARSHPALDFSEPHRIIFDRPFMLIVYDEVTGVIVLIGKIINPTEK